MGRVNLATAVNVKKGEINELKRRIKICQDYRKRFIKDAQRLKDKLEKKEIT